MIFAVVADIENKECLQLKAVTAVCAIQWLWIVSVQITDSGENTL